MGEIADGLINGDFDFYTGEYLGRGGGFPRTGNKSLPWERGVKRDRTHNPRKGVMMYIHRLYIGKAKMPSALKIADHYAAEKKIVFTTKEEMFQAISDNFIEFKNWMDVNAGKMYQTY